MNKNIELDIISRYKNGNSCRKIAKDIGVVHRTVSLVLKKYNIDIKLFNRFKLNPSNREDAINSYNNKELNTIQLANKYGVSKNAIRNFFIKSGVKIRTKSERMRRYSYDEEFFNIIDSQEKAYILGFMYADGYNNGKNAIAINIHSKDIDILEKIKEKIKYEGIIYQNLSRKNQCTLSIASTKLVEQLNRLGCVRKKSLILKFPTKNQVPEHLVRHFIRGYMDGDGCISVDKRKNQGCVSFVGSNCFIDELQIYIYEKLQKTGYKRVVRNVKELVYGGQKQSVLILDFIYHGASIYLDRKYQKYLSIKNRIDRRLSDG